MLTETTTTATLEALADELDVIETRVNEFRSKAENSEGSELERAQLKREIDDLKTSLGRITRELDAARYKRIEECEARIATLADETLVTAFMSLLQPFEHEGCRYHIWGGISEPAAVTTRTVFLEIAQRWLPMDPVARAFEWLDSNGVPPIPGTVPSLKLIES